MILQLAIDMATNYKTNEIVDRINRENFKEYLEEMFKNSEERIKKDNPSTANEINDNKHLVIINSKFDDKWEWTQDALFSEFVKGLATNSEKFFKMAEEYSNNLSRKKENDFYGNDGFMNSLGLYEIVKMQEHLRQKYEGYLGIMYLMRKNWHCDKIGKELKENERKECQKNRKYLDILYEYFFRLYVEAKHPNVSKQLPPLVKPIFIEGEYIPVPLSLIEIIENLNDHSKYFWKKDEKAPYGIKLVNKEELNFEIKEKENDIKDQNWSCKSNQNVKEKIKGPKNVKKRKEILYGGPTDSKIKKKGQKLSNKNEIDKLWEEFDIKMDELCQKTKENANEEKEKLEKALTKAKDEQEKYILELEYKRKFGTFNSSPFSKKNSDCSQNSGSSSDCFLIPNHFH